ncbi:MAG: cytidylyltransferase domain-containing protein [Solirubrobacterales bacterium]
MIEGRRVLGIIPARGGSKGVPRKNIRLVFGKPLIAWTILEAGKSKYLDRVILSSEDEEIIRIAKQYGCDVPFIRPAELARDDTPGIDPVLHALTELPEYDYAVLLQATSPLRRAEDIDRCIELSLERDAPVASVAESPVNPYWMYKLNQQGQLEPVMTDTGLITRRQNLPKVFTLNGAVYVAERGFLCQNRSFVTKATIGYEMPNQYSIDIDSEFDLQVLGLFEEEFKRRSIS